MNNENSYTSNACYLLLYPKKYVFRSNIATAVSGVTIFHPLQVKQLVIYIIRPSSRF